MQFLFFFIIIIIIIIINRVFGPRCSSWNVNNNHTLGTTDVFVRDDTARDTVLAPMIIMIFIFEKRKGNKMHLPDTTLWLLFRGLNDREMDHPGHTGRFSSFARIGSAGLMIAIVDGERKEAKRNEQSKTWRKGTERNLGVDM